MLINMKYVGGKSKIADQIIALFPPKIPVYEPFCGGLNITSKACVAAANDINTALITLYRALQNGFELPDIVDENMYNIYKKNQDPNDPLTAFIGIGCSFGGKWFGGYARGNTTNGIPRNCAAESKRRLEKDIKQCNRVLFFNENYVDFLKRIPLQSVIYFDPPYKSTLGYKDKFNHDEFYDIVRELKGKYSIFISEYEMPNDFQCIKEINHFHSIRKKSASQRQTERVFTI